MIAAGIGVHPAPKSAANFPGAGEKISWNIRPEDTTEHWLKTVLWKFAKDSRPQLFSGVQTDVEAKFHRPIVY